MDQKLTVYSGTDLVGYLLPSDGLRNCQVTLDLVDNTNVLKFDLPFDSAKWSLLEDPDLRIVVDGHEFVLMNPVDQDKDGRLWGHVEMSESQALLGRKLKTIGDVDLAVTILSGEAGQGGFAAGSAGSALYRLLDGSDWSVGTVDVAGTHDLETEKISILENIMQVKKIWGGWLVFDSVNKTVSLRDETLWANDTGYEIRYSKNQKSLKKTTKWDGVITKLWPFGEKDLDIADVNSGVKYLEDYSYTTQIREYPHRWENIADQDELLATAQAYLSKVSRPQVQYSSKTLDLRTLAGHTHETFNVGDIVTIQDEDLANAVKVRLIYHSYDVIQPWNCDVKLGDPLNDRLRSISDAVSGGQFTNDNLIPSKALSQLLKGNEVWTDHAVDNVDATHGLTLYAYLPSETLSVTKAILRFKLLNFRAYETGAASGGGATSGASSTSTTPSGGGSTSGASSSSTTASGGGSTSGASSISTTPSGGGSTSGSSSITTTAEGGAHRHIMLDYYDSLDGGYPLRRFKADTYSGTAYLNVPVSDYVTLYTKGQDQAHSHGMSHTHTTPNHSHNIEHTHTIPDHTHGMSHTHTTPDHTHNIEHTHTIPNHTHEIIYGIYEGTAATGVTVKINGTDRTAALGGGAGFTTDQTDLDIKSYLVAGQYNEIVLGSSQLGRFDASIWLQVRL